MKKIILSFLIFVVALAILAVACAMIIPAKADTPPEYSATATALAAEWGEPTVSPNRNFQGGISWCWYAPNGASQCASQSYVYQWYPWFAPPTPTQVYRTYPGPNQPDPCSQPYPGPACSLFDAPAILPDTASQPQTPSQPEPTPAPPKRMLITNWRHRRP